MNLSIKHIASVVMLGATLSGSGATPHQLAMSDTTATVIEPISIEYADTLFNGKVLTYEKFNADPATRYTSLTDEDYAAAADELGIEIATIRAVVEIEAGRSQAGFSEPEKPIINFDSKLFRAFLLKRKINPAEHTGNEAFGSLNIRKYGSPNNAQWARLEAGRTINNDIANEATFWGMFQIGGFNWNQCSVSSIDEFVFLMSYSEHMQLELFVRFIKKRNMAEPLRKKNWARFAYLYNGPKYAARGYHTKLEAAYNKYRRISAGNQQKQ